MKGYCIMSIPSGFKIRKKADVNTFITKCMVNDNEYFIIIQNDFAIFFRKYTDGEISVSIKRGNLSDIFNPTIEVAKTKDNCYKETVEDYVWKYRKYINAKWFNG